MIQVLLICILVGFIISFLMIISLRRFESGRLERVYPIVEARFAQLSVVTENPRLSFDGETAETIHDFLIEAGQPGNDWISLNRICRNQFGEYFHIVISCEDGNAYINHLSAERAALALKETGTENLPPIETIPVSLTSAERHNYADAPVSSYPAVIRNNEDASKHTAGTSGYEEDINTPALLRAISGLPLEKQWFGSLVGFGASFIFLAFTFRFDPRYTINLSWLLIRGLMYLGVLMLVSVVYKKWQGDRWNVRRLFPRLLYFFMHLAVWGVASAAVIYNAIIWFSAGK